MILRQSDVRTFGAIWQNRFSNQQVKRKSKLQLFFFYCVVRELLLMHHNNLCSLL